MSKIKQATKKTGKARKELIVAELVEKIEASNGLVFTDYKGLTHKQLEDLKRELKKLDSTMIIAKNTLLKLAIDKSKFKENGKDLESVWTDPTATLFISGDMVEPLKKVAKLVKDAGLPKIKIGILEGNVTDEAGVLQIASLPGRETLLAQLVGMLNSPIQGFVSGLNAIPQKFVMTLDAVRAAKPSSPAAAAEEPEAPADPAQANAQVPISEDAQTPVEPAPEPNKPVEESPAPVETDENVQSAEASMQPSDNSNSNDEEVK